LNFSKRGSGTTTISGANNSYTGDTRILGGILRVALIADGGVNSSIGASSNVGSNLQLQDGTLEYYGATDVTTDRLIQIKGNAIISVTGSGYLYFNNTAEISYETSVPNQLTFTGTLDANNRFEPIIGDDAGSTTNVVKDGTGSWTLSGANTYSGTTTITAGTLKLGAAGVIPDASAVTVTGTLDMNDFSETVGSISGGGIIDNVAGAGTPTLTCGGDNTSTEFSGIIQNTSGTLGITKEGTGTLTLSGTNTYTAATTISAGVLELGNGGTTGTIVGNITDNATFTYNRSDSYDYAGVISGSGNLHINDGTLILSGTNTFTGTNTIDASTTLQIGNEGTTGSVVVGIVNNGTLTFNRTNNYSYSGVISGTGDLNQNGTGVLTLSGANTYSGITTIKTQCKLIANHATALGNTTGGTVIEAGNTNSTLEIGNGITITGETLTMNSNSAGDLRSNLLVNTGNTGTWNGTITIAGSRYCQLYADGTLNIQGTINGSSTDNFYLRGTGTGTCSAAISIGSTPFAKHDAGTWTISSSGNTWGSTSVSNGGPLKLGSADVIPDASAVTIAAATLDLNGFDETVGSITSSGTIDNTSGSGTYTLTCGENNASTTFSGILQNTSGTLALTKVGTGKLILSGDNTYSGTTTISAGTLQIGNASTTGILPSACVNNATLTFNRSDTYSYTGLISGTGAVNQIGAGILYLSGANTYSGTTTIAASRKLYVGHNTALGDVAGSVELIAGNPSTLLTILTGKTVTGKTLILNTTSAGSLQSSLQASGTATWDGTITLAGDGTCKLWATNGNVLNIDGTIDGSCGTLELTGAASGSPGLGNMNAALNIGATAVSKELAGTWTLNSANTFTGGITINDGTLNINNAQALGTVASTFTYAGGTINNTSGGAITTLNYPLALNADLTFTGTSNLDLGDGAVTLSASRQITCNGGTLTIGGAFNHSTYNITKAGVGTFALDNQTITINNLTINAGSLNASTSSINLNGDLSGAGSFNCNTSTVSLVGTTGSQNIYGTTFYNLILNNSDGAVLNGNISVNGTITLTDGILTTGANQINLGSGGIIDESTPSVTAPTSYVTGTVITTRPLMTGVNNTFGGIGVELTENNTNNNSTVVTRVTGTACTGEGHNSILRYFTITPTVDAGLDASMVFHYFDNEIVGHSEPLLYIFKSTDNRVTWTPINPIRDYANNTLSLTTIASFSDWTASDGASESLPIELINFDANISSNIIEFEWLTASEISNNFFTIEQSLDGENWEAVVVVQSKGNSHNLQEYKEEVTVINSDVKYFRLKQTDFDGSSSYSKVILINPIKTYDEGSTIIYNSNSQTIEINYSNYAQKNFEFLELINTNGQKVFLSNFLVEKIQKESLPIGIYYVFCKLKNSTIVKRIIIN